MGLLGISNAFDQVWMRFYPSSGSDITLIQGTFLNTSVDEFVVERLNALSFVQAAPMIYNVAAPMICNVMDLTPQVSGIALMAGLIAEGDSAGARSAAFSQWGATL